MANFLITGARAPVALELSRNLAKEGHTVYIADSLLFPLAKHSKFVKKTFHITGPRKSLKQFKNDLENILIKHDIECLIPTCEEVFYISSIKAALELYTKVFCPEFNLIKTLHSKYDVYKVAKNSGFYNPNTEMLTGDELIRRKRYIGKVVKKEFCRFGTDILIDPTFNDVLNFVGNKFNEKFVIQDKVEGIEYCTYSIVNKGHVLFSSIYRPKYKIQTGASIYFKPFINENISKAVIQFCKNNNVTGQIGFDVIVNAMGIFLLECNPRATSGVHLLSKNALADAFLGDGQFLENNCNLTEPKTIKLAMLLIGLPFALKKSQLKQFVSDYQMASDIISVKEDNSFMFFSLLSLLEICVISLKAGTSFRSATTFDIEWDGKNLYCNDHYE